MMRLAANDLTVEFKNGYKGVKDISFDIGNGIYGLLGENGAGKTTLMRVLTTVTRQTSGKISLGGISYKDKNYPALKKKIGYLPQELNLYPNLTVKDTLMYLGELSGLDKHKCKDRIEY